MTSSHPLPVLECAICHERRTAFVCPDCNHHSWHPRRRNLLHTLHHNTALTEQIAARLTQRAQDEQREQERSQRRRRLDEVQQLLVIEQSKIDRLRAINRARRTLLAHRQEVVVKADSMLHNELRTLLQQRLPDLMSLLDSRLQHSLKSLRRQQYSLLSLLFHLLSFRRLTSSSLSLVGLPLPDNLETDVIEFEQHATAMGYLLRVVQLTATYLQVHLPFAMYFHPTFAALSSSSSFSFSSTSPYPPFSSSPAATASVPSSSSSSAYVLSPVSWDGRPQADEYRRSLALIAHNVVFLCRTAGMSDSVRLWRVGGNLLDLLQAVTLGLYERRRQELTNQKATRDEQWSRQRDGDEKDKQEQQQQQAEMGGVEELTGDGETGYGVQLLDAKLDAGGGRERAVGDVRSVRFAAIAVANVNADDAEWDLVETEQLDEWDE